MDLNFKKQIINDFSIGEEKFNSKNNIFTSNEPKDDFLFYNRSDFSLICTDNRVFMRSDNSKLMAKLESTYKNYPSQWFAEIANIRKLSSILAEFDIEIDNFFPLMTYGYKKIETSKFDFVRVEKEDIQKFKGKSKMPFCFDESDRLGLAYYDENKLIGLAGASVSGKYLWNIGFEKFYFDENYKGLGTYLLEALSIIVIEENKDISPITATQFSHTRSINTAIRAGFEMNLCITGKMQ